MRGSADFFFTGKSLENWNFANHVDSGGDCNAVATTDNGSMLTQKLWQKLKMFTGLLVIHHHLHHGAVLICMLTVNMSTICSLLTTSVIAWWCTLCVNILARDSLKKVLYYTIKILKRLKWQLQYLIIEPCMYRDTCAEHYLRIIPYDNAPKFIGVQALLKT